MPGDVVVVFDEPVYHKTFETRDSMVGRDLGTRAGRVQKAAKRQAHVKTGKLVRSIHKQWVKEEAEGDVLSINVGSPLDYAIYHHEGTRPHVIRPKNAKALRWVGDDGKVHFAKVVHHPGTKPNRFLTDNLLLVL